MSTGERARPDWVGRAKEESLWQLHQWASEYERKGEGLKAKLIRGLSVFYGATAPESALGAAADVVLTGLSVAKVPKMIAQAIKGAGTVQKFQRRVDTAVKYEKMIHDFAKAGDITIEGSGKFRAIKDPLGKWVWKPKPSALGLQSATSKAINYGEEILELPIATKKGLSWISRYRRSTEALADKIKTKQIAGSAMLGSGQLGQRPPRPTKPEFSLVPKHASTPPMKPHSWPLVQPAGTPSHTVQPGENLSRIAKQYGVPLKDFISANPDLLKRHGTRLRGADYLRINDQLKLPDSARVRLGQPSMAPGTGYSLIADINPFGRPVQRPFTAEESRRFDQWARQWVKNPAALLKR